MAMLNISQEKTERLAQSLARGTLNPYWVVNNLDRYYAIKRPLNITAHNLGTLQHFLAGIGVSIICEFDETGKRSIL